MEQPKQKVLVLGSQGMLGQELVQVFSGSAQYEVIGWDREEIDLTDSVHTETKIREIMPSILLNAVAYNAVDLCETNEEEYEKACVLNTKVPERLAQLAGAIGAIFVHYSTDYVFPGIQEQGYTEDETPQPVSRYGLTKWEGEQAVLSMVGTHYVIRLSKLFGKPALSAAGKQSFFEKMLVIAEGKTEVSAVESEQSCFTYAPDLAEATRTLIEDHVASGIYHLINSGVATWYEAAQELFRLVRPDIIVRPVSPDAFSRPAKRPAYSELLNTKRPLLRDYREALREFVSGK
ncbi:MAG: dTDP-4-dehydrorhamnose reductase [Candidatus Moranbacteria bacterium]|jgi:dTDP-4-dehydrorhamnose reductase|nr:dTDP-4-dehydrorhamnose reductase [Candidatus Moranbacteria bacterium]MBP9801225.1 dTDP-4-dehydrorhamnose reductase [Candidatus Moranbacteria bacterium]